MAWLNNSKNNNLPAAADDNNVIVAIDMGSYKLRMIAGRVDREHGDVEVLGYHEVPSSGIIAGSVSDLGALSAGLSQLISEFRNKTDIDISHCVLGISGKHIWFRNEHGNATVPSGKVTEQDRDKAIENARSVALPEGHIMLDVIEQNYKVENSNDVINPIGLHAMRLDVFVHIISCQRDHLNNLRSAIQNVSSDIFIDHAIYNGIAAGRAVLSQSERDIGVCVIDYGYGTVNVAVYSNKRLIFSFGLDDNYGGREITRTIATHFGIAIKQAEALQNLGAATEQDLEPNMPQSFAVKRDLNSDEEVQVYISDVVSIIKSKVTEMFERVINEIENNTQPKGAWPQFSLGAGFVITGGMANTHGLAHALAEKLHEMNNGDREVYADDQNRIMIRGPQAVTPNTRELTNPDKSVIIGLLREAVDKGTKIDSARSDSGNKTVLGRIIEWLKQEL